MCCSKCGFDKRIVNKHFYLCNECNNERLHGSKYGKQYDNIKKSIKPIRTVKNNKRKSLFGLDTSKENKGLSNYEKDEIFYEECFNSCKIHKCEECGDELPSNFRDDNGKIEARYRYSHIIPKSIAPEIRHKLININHLCLSDHQKWESGDNKDMKIFIGNSKRLPKYF